MSAKAAPIILSFVLLSACASREEIASRKAQAEQVAQSQRESRCTSFGYQRGSPDFSKCLENMFIHDQQQAAVQRAEDDRRAQALGDGLKGAGAALSNISKPSTSVTCSTF